MLQSEQEGVCGAVVDCQQDIQVSSQCWWYLSLNWTSFQGYFQNLHRMLEEREAQLMKQAVHRSENLEKQLRLVCGFS